MIALLVSYSEHYFEEEVKMRIVLALSWVILYLGFFSFNAFAVEGVSDAKKVAEDLAKQYASALRVAYNGGLPGGVTTNKHTEFWDRVIQKLHSLNDGFGYIGHFRSDGKLNVRLADLLCYIPDIQHRPSQGNPTGNTEEFFQVDFIGGGPDRHLRWSHGSMEERRRLKDNEGKVGRCVFPRPGAPNYGYVPNHPGPVVGSGSGTNGGGGNTNSNTSVAARDLTLSEAKDIIKQLEDKHPEALKIAYNSYPKGDRDLKNHSRTEFWDRVIQKLHSIDPGYCYVRGRDGRHMTDLLGHCPHQYRSSDCNTAAGGSLAEFTTLDFIASTHSGGGRRAYLWWGNPGTFESRKARLAEIRKKEPNHLPHPIWRGHCVFPRPGAPDYGYANASGGSGTNHTKIVGACGSYKGANDASCQSGKFGVGPGDTDTDYRWVCQNIPNDGQTVCSEPRPNPVILGRCNSYQGANDDSCTAGKFHSHPPDTDTEFLWTCRNIPHNGEMGCSEQRPDPVTVGQCGPYQGDGDASCVSGEFHPHPGHTQAEYRWICRNIPHKSFNGKREEECQQSKAETGQDSGNIPENSSNNSSVVLGKCGKIYWGAHDASCESGKFHPSPGNTSTEFRWSCRNIPYDGGAEVCRLPKPAIYIRQGM